VGNADATDPGIMRFAAENDFAVLTHDLDFGAILAAADGRKPSVVQIRAENLSVEAVGAEVVAALRQMETELEMRARLSIDPIRARLIEGQGV
jgi:predicted nuclease of predicted toxin-antitoxin system